MDNTREFFTPSQGINTPYLDQDKNTNTINYYNTKSPFLNSNDNLSTPNNYQPYSLIYNNSQSLYSPRYPLKTYNYSFSRQYSNNIQTNTPVDPRTPNEGLSTPQINTNNQLISSVQMYTPKQAEIKQEGLNSSYSSTNEKEKTNNTQNEIDSISETKKYIIDSNGERIQPIIQNIVSTADLGYSPLDLKK